MKWPFSRSAHEVFLRQENERLRTALERIYEQNTPKSNATVRRMADIAWKALLS